MKLMVKVLKGPECSIEIAESCHVSELKLQVERELGMSVDTQKLVQQGRSLPDDKTLAECKVQDGSKIFLVIKKSEGSNGPRYFDLLYKLLCKHFTETDAKLVFNEYKKNFDEMLANLTLDDIERLAITNLAHRDS